MVFPIVVYSCESWTINKAERPRIDAFELWYWRRLENPLDCQEIQPVHLKGNLSEYSSVKLMLKLKLQWPPDEKNWLVGKDPHAGKDWRQEKKWMTDGEMVGWHHWLDEHEFEQAPGVGDRPGKPGVLQSMGLQSQTWLSDWTELNWTS